MKYYLLFLLTALTLFTSCNQLDNYGEKVEFGESEVFYKGKGVTEKQAQSLGDYLEEQGFFKGAKKSVQLTHDGEDYLVRFVVDEEKLNDEARLNWWKMQYDLTEEVFDGEPARIALADDKMKDLQVLNPIARYSIGKSSIYYDNSEVKKADVKTLAEFFTTIGLLGEDKAADAFYQKEDKVPVIRMIVDPEKITDELLPYFSFYQDQMRETVFDGKKAKMILTSTAYEDLDPLPKLTAQQKQTFLDEINQTTNSNDQNPDVVVDTTVTQTTQSGVLRLPNN